MRVRRAGLSLMAVVVTLVLLEGMARVATFFFPTSVHEYRRRRPEPYRNAAYFSSRFVREMTVEPGGWYTPAGSRLVIPRDYTGRYFRVENGYRRTCGQPDRFEGTVYVFGGSTVYCAEVPDEYTLCSRLQHLLGQASFSHRIVNVGSSSVKATQQTERLRAMGDEVTAGDVVLFYDGINEVLQTLYYGDPEGWILRTDRELAASAPPVRKALLALDRAIRGHSRLVKVLLRAWEVGWAPAHLADPDRRGFLLQQLEQRYERDLREAHAFCSERRICFVHALQPNIWTLPRRTPYEERLVSNMFLTPRGMDAAFALGNPVLKEVSARLSKQGVRSVDLGGILDRRAPGAEYYLDFMHVDDEGNEIIAGALLEAIRPCLGPPDKE